jgi:hypothetical protein
MLVRTASSIQRNCTAHYHEYLMQDHFLRASLHRLAGRRAQPLTGPHSADVDLGFLGTGPVLQRPPDSLLKRIRLPDATQLCEDRPPRSLLVGQPSELRSSGQRRDQVLFAKHPQPVHGSKRAEPVPPATIGGAVWQDIYGHDPPGPPHWVGARPVVGFGAAGLPTDRFHEYHRHASMASCRTVTRSGCRVVGRRFPRRCALGAGRSPRAARLHEGALLWFRRGRVPPPSPSCPARW